MTTYPQTFYADRHARTQYAARTVLSLLLAQLPPIKSAVDLGCGVGTWLSVCQEQGVTEIQGYDGAWVDPTLLVIPRNCFTPIDLSQVAVPLTKTYDLAMSLEVAEHLPETQATALVLALTTLSSIVLFSAAIPGQGGTGHVNEQWPSYWAELFASMGYEVQDMIRLPIWRDKKIDYWYRQNLLVFVKPGSAPALEWPVLPLDVVHPELYLQHAKPGVKGSWARLTAEVRRYLRAQIGKEHP